MKRLLRPTNPADSSQQGVSLIAVAVILVVAGLVIASLLSLFNKRARRDYSQESKQMLKQARREIVGFAIDRCMLLTHDAGTPCDNFFEDYIGHIQDRSRGTLGYFLAPELQAVACNGTDFDTVTSTSLDLNIPEEAGALEDLAFIVWTTGKNQAQELDDTASPVFTMPGRDQTVDDAVDYVTWDWLQDKLGHCEPGGGGGNPPEPPEPPAPPEPLPPNPLPEEFPEPEAGQPALPNWDPAEGEFDVNAGYASGGQNQELLITVGGDAHEVLLIYDSQDQPDLMQQAWNASNATMSYDVQVKLGQDWRILSSAYGLSFRLHELDNGEIEMYGVSFYQERGGDAIPNDIQPPGIGEDDRLILLWKQWWDPDADGGNGELMRDWIAYKNVNEAGGVVPRRNDWNGGPFQPEDYLPDGAAFWDTDYPMRGWQWYYDSWTFTDQSTMLIRVRENPSEDNKVNDIQVFYGDCSIIFGPAKGIDHTLDHRRWPIHRVFERNGDDNATNFQCPNPVATDDPDEWRCDVRLPYYPNHMFDDDWLSGLSPIFPTWPPGGEELVEPEVEFEHQYNGTWAPSVDYFTLITDWVVNTDAEPEPELLFDGSTIRDASLTTPNRDTSLENDGFDDRREFALHGFCNELDDTTRLYYEEFAIAFRRWYFSQHDFD